MNKDDEFIDSLYSEADKQLNDTYKKKKESRDELLKAIAMILLTYTIVDNVLSLSEKDYNKEYSLLGALIVKLSKGNIRQEINNTTNILRNTVKNTYKHYSYNHNLKDVEKIINDNFKGKHFSDRVWENEQEVAKKLTQQCQDFLRGKINVNQIAKEIKDTYNTSAYNAKRLAETEVSRCHSAAFDRFCKETGVKKVKYNARKCNTCARCMDDDGKIFDLKNKPELPRHPMCKCYYDIVDDNKRVTASNKNDIIKENNTELFRKSDDDRGEYSFISDEAFNRLTIKARKNGAMILRGTQEVEEHLDNLNAAASNIGDVILFRKEVCISEVLEETYHFEQNLMGLNNDKPEPLRSILNEIDAKEYLIKNAKKFKIPRKEIELTKRQLKSYKMQLKSIKGSE